MWEVVEGVELATACCRWAPKLSLVVVTSGSFVTSCRLELPNVTHVYQECSMPAQNISITKSLQELYSRIINLIRVYYTHLHASEPYSYTNALHKGSKLLHYNSSEKENMYVNLWSPRMYDSQHFLMTQCSCSNVTMLWNWHCREEEHFLCPKHAQDPLEKILWCPKTAINVMGLQKLASETRTGGGKVITVM